MLTVILLSSALISFLTFSATYKPQAKYKNGMLFAVTLPPHALECPEIEAVRASFGKRYARNSIWMIAGLVPFVFMFNLVFYQVLYFFIWFSLFFFLMGAPFRRAFRETLALKRKHEWFVGEKKVILGDLRTTRLKNQRSAPLWLYIIPFAMGAALLLVGLCKDTQLVSVLSGGIVITGLFLLISVLSRRTKAKVYSENSEVNLALNQARRRALSYLWILLAVAENIHFLLIYLLLANTNEAMEGFWITLIVLATLVPVGLLVYVYRRIQKQEEEVLSQDGKVIRTDDDEYWANGIIYHNPYDKSVFVTKRVGIGDTVNTATVAGKLIVWGSAGLLAVVVLGVSLMMILSELNPPVLSIKPDREVEISYPLYSFDFNLSEVEQLDLVEHMPTGSRTNGEATEQHARGYFHLKGIGKARLYVYRENPPYIRIKLKDTYVFYNEKDPLRTKELFGQLQEKLGR
ncbi:DUF5808 domain-containing protein [Paenibacillus tuaregi]|uniref:DUF5808 domain-containing protein n=1 Tax=Paenibacillus tuaregi TaxID=1816681 RepID=UPI000838D842|nr:DUF5808 domain-containing protein [Paenibacillus tuaregi]